ncbi:hypothetical protein LWI28_005871 [Acer negundo]|uniref:Uncharacterized protein n=1 Tax=Acer negundo TaxID=4023 RepID=A0AAD5P0T7_ACENE|nr:hypothetical protein LWI28_005871 [Acer negundo]
MEEIGRGLLDSGHPFLWVIRSEKGNGDEEEKLSCMEELEQQGMIVLESLVSGVVVVAFPQCSDQTTNKMLIEKEWRTVVRVKLNEQGVAVRKEINRCLQVVMGGGDRTQELRANAKKWKDLTRETAKNGGSSHNNLKAFVDEFRSCCSN